MNNSKPVWYKVSWEEKGTPKSKTFEDKHEAQDFLGKLQQRKVDNLNIERV